LDYSTRSFTKGVENQAVDALSRQPDSHTLLAASTITPRWLDIIVESYHQDAHSKQLLAELALTGSNEKRVLLTRWSHQIQEYDLAR